LAALSALFCAFAAVVMATSEHPSIMRRMNNVIGSPQIVDCGFCDRGLVARRQGNLV
jgi:hypothetical protein